MIRAAFVIALALAAPARAEVEQGPPNVPEFEPAFANQTRAPEIRDGIGLAVQRIVGGLVHPWGIAVLPGGGYLVTERVGRLVHIAPGGKVTRIAGVPEVAARGQGGMLDVAIADDFATSRRVFLTYSRPVGARTAATAVAAARLSQDGCQLTGLRDIFVQSPAVRTVNHFGSRIVIDGDFAYVTLGDRRTPEQVQNLTNTLGKVVRITLDGRIPASNPYAGQSGARGEIWSHGHRNPQGADLHPRTGELWTLEHGPKGGDELNRVRPGRNYGWPVVSYGENYNGTPVGTGRSSADGISEPVYYWDPVIAPGGFAFYDGAMFKAWQGDVVAAALAGRGIVRLKLDGDRVTGEARHLRQLGRVRDVEIDRDGAILLVTDDPRGGLFRVVPE